MKRGRDVVFDYLRDLEVEYLFGVPGTNEVPIIDGTNVAENGVEYVPCLHENIAVGAALGYARASGKPGVVELHVTPGAAHGIGNLFNAYKAHVPVVILCAQQHSTLLAQEPILASDLVQVARQYTKWAYEVRFPDELPLVLQRAFKEALSPPMRPVFLSIPWDYTLAPAQDGPPRVTRVGRHFVGDIDEVERAAALLATATSPIVVVGDGVGAAGAWAEIDRLGEIVGAPVRAESLQSYLNFPNDHYRWKGELPQTQTAMQAVFEGHDVAFLCGYNAQAQVLVFDYSLGPMIPAAVSQIYLHDDPWEIGKNAYGEAAILGDIKATLPVLCDAITASAAYDAAAAEKRNAALQDDHADRRSAIDAHVEELAGRPPDVLATGDDIALAIAALQPEMTAPLMLSNEAVSDVGAFESHIHYQDPASYFFGVGGSLGFSMPAALGMKLATGSSRTVVNVVGDGSALFYPHAWWTATKFDLPILFVITNNREYKTLLLGLQALEKIYSWQPAGPPSYLHLDKPMMSFVDLAHAFGVAGAIAPTLGDLAPQLRAGLDVVNSGQPFVLEVLTDPSLPAPGAPVAALSATKEDDRVRSDAGLDYFGPA
jgi:benzoylformate decarboxylase